MISTATTSPYKIRLFELAVIGTKVSSFMKNNKTLANLENFAFWEKGF